MRATGIIPAVDSGQNVASKRRRKTGSGTNSQNTPATSQNNSNPAVKAEATTDVEVVGAENDDVNAPDSSHRVSTIGVKPEPGNSENLGPNETSELAKLRDQVARLRSDNSHLKKKLSNAKGSKKAHGLVKKEKRRILGSNNAIDLTDSDPEVIVIDLSSDD